MTSHPTATTRRERKRLRIQIDQLITDLEIPVPFDITAFCDRIAARRGRGVTLVAASELLGERVAPFSGLWIAAQSTDYLFYDDSTSRLHWENSVLHELGHLLLGHRPHGTLSRDQLDLLQLLLPGLSAERLIEIARGALGRAGYTGHEERAAEMFAARVWQRAGRILIPTTSSRAATPAEAQVIQRLADTLGPGTGTRS